MDTWKEIQKDLEVICSKKPGMNALNDIFIQNEAREGHFKSSLPAASGTIFVDLVKEETVWSRGIYDLLGFEPRSIDSTSEVFLSHVLETDRPIVEGRMKDALSGKKKEDYISYRIKSKEGKIQKVLALPHLILDPDDQPISLQVTIHNLSDISQVSGNTNPNLELSTYRLQQSTRWLSKIFDNSAFGIFIFDGLGQILQSNQMFSKITGYSQEELRDSVTAFDMVSKDHLSWVMEKSMSLLSGKEEKVNYEFPIITKSGHYKQVEGYTTILDHEEGILLCFVSDIDEKKETLEALKLSESRLSEAQKMARLGSWELDFETGDIAWSDGMFEIMETDPNTELDKDLILSLIHPEDKQEFIATIFEGSKEVKGLEIRHVTKSGIKYIVINSAIEYKGEQKVKYRGTVQDVSESKIFCQHLELAQEIANLGWWESNLVTGKDTWSDSIYNILGLDKETTTPSFETYQTTIHPDDLEKVLNTMGNPEVLKNGFHNREVRHRLKDGSIRYILTSARFLWDGDRPVNMIGTLMDITQTKEVQLRLSEAQKIANVGWWEFDLTGNGNNKYSKEYMELMEMNCDQDIKTFEDFLEYVHPEDRKLILDINDTMIEDRGWNNLVYRIKSVKGGYKYLKSNATIELSNGVPQRMLGSIYEVTDFKNIENELAKSEINLKALIASTDNLVFVIDDELKFREVFCKDLSKIHYEPDYFAGKNLEQVWNKNLPHGVKLANICKNSMQNGKENSIVYPFSPKGGKSYWWEANVHPFEGQDGRKRLAVFINDITTKKQAEEELIKNMHKERELNEMSTQFVSMASHQFRTPLTVIKSNMQLLELSGIDHPIIKKVSGRLATEVDRLVNLMEDMLAMGKVQSGSIKPNLKKTDMVSLVNKLKLNIERVQKDGRTLQLAIKGTKRQVSIDPQFMEHALNNLIDNAFKYSKGSRDPEIEITYASKKVHIKISDYGLGIPDADRSRLFGSFQRGSNVQHISGTGLGLAVTKEFISLNRGTIFLDNDKDKTTFCIDLPLN